MSKRAVTKAVEAIQKFYPIALADKSWDNTGLLVDASTEANSDKLDILLTIDLTQDVADEAIGSGSNLIMAYHPFIFRGLKSITPQDPQQKSLLKLIKNDISVYCPHTAVDSAVGGVNDFLVDGITNGFKVQSRKAIEEDKAYPDCGAGRIVTLEQPVALSKLVENAKNSLGLSYLQLALGRGQTQDHQIQSIAVCAGSGGGVFKGVNADLFYTGELSHHEALFFSESGSSVIACNHSNTERAFLKVIKEQLQQELPNSNILISKKDKDPFQTV